MLIRSGGISAASSLAAGSARLISFSDAWHALQAGLDVYLFLIGMMVLAELARYEGLFDWVAGIAVERARGSSARLFLLIYSAGALITVLLSNDATAVVLTPAVIAAARRARVPPEPHLLACALIANAASFVLPISNPANLVVYGAEMPSLLPWLRIFLLPSLVSILATFLALRLLSRRALRSEIKAAEKTGHLSRRGRLALIALLLAAAVLLTASGLGVPLGAPTCGAALAALLLVVARDRSALVHVLRGVSWGILPLVGGLFILVEALNRAGLLQLATAGFRHLLPASHAVAGVSSAFAIGFLANVMNNLPVGLAAGLALHPLHQASALTSAVLIGVDLGPNLSVTGSLATILWLIALRRDQVEITAWSFLKVGAIAMPCALLLSVLAMVAFG